jgi:hypothetical protein
MISSKQRRPLAVAAFCAAVLFALIVDTANGRAAAAGLFDPANSADMRAAPAGSGEGARRDRLVRLNAGELALMIPTGADAAADRIQRAQSLKGAATLELFPDVSVTLERVDIEAPDEGGYVWIGRTGGTRPASATLVINDNEITGQVQAGGKVYSIEPVSGGLHRIIEIDQSQIRDDLHVGSAPGQPKDEATQAPPGEPRAGTTINVLVAHTKNARIEAGSSAKMQARINLAVSLANQSFKNSGVNITYKRVGNENEINYPDLSFYGGSSDFRNYTGALCDLSNFDCRQLGVTNNHTAMFGSLRTKRTTVKADLVVLMRKQGAACGVAWVPDPPSAHTANQGFAVVTSTNNYFCVETFALAHETGHNMGLNHDRIQDRLDNSPDGHTPGPIPPKNKFNYGHVDKIGKFFTIMSYQSSCPKCAPVNYYSTPLKNEPKSKRPLGVKAGVAGISGAADSVRTLNSMRDIIGGYR